MQLFPILVGEKLVVGTSGDDSALQSGNGILVNQWEEVVIMEELKQTLTGLCQKIESVVQRL